MNLFYCNALTGGAADALDGVDPLDAVGDGSSVVLVAGDMCKVIEDDTISWYILRNSAGATESSPLVIIPDSTPGNLWWELVDSFNSGMSDALAYANLPGGF